MSPYIRRLREKVGSDLLQLHSTTAIVLDDQRRVLLLRHADTGRWVAPGGSIEPGESPADAVVREVWEETGLVIGPVRILGVHGGPEFVVTYGNGDRVSYVMTVFECHVVGGSLNVDGSEILGARFVAEDELASLDLSSWARALLPRILRDGVQFTRPTWGPPESLAAGWRKRHGKSPI